MKFYITFLLYCFAIVSAQTTFTTIPEFPTQTDQITITFDVTNASHGNKIVGYAGQVYAHTGVTIVTNNGTPEKWKNVIGSWGNNTQQPMLTRVGTDQYQIVINNPRAFYGVNNSNQVITELTFVLRSADATKQTEDIFIPLYSAGIRVVLSSPKFNVDYGDPLRSPVFISPNDSLPITATTSEIGTKTKSMSLYINGIQKTETDTRYLNYTFAESENPSWKNEIKIIAVDTANVKDSTVFVIVNNKVVKELPLPDGNQIGINYESNPTKVTLALFAPRKSFIYILGDFNNWKVDSGYYMTRHTVTQDSVIWWITIPNLSPAKEYAYQFLIDGELRIQDPYTEKILDPWNDYYFSSTYANAYPSNKTEGIASIFQTAQTKYNWKVSNFEKPVKEKLIIYELLIRDFVSTHLYTTLMDTLSYFKKLGVNAIELMPVNEFEGNSSWGYNTMMYFAPDKYYGTKKDLQEFIDACHQNGIAVILDMVFNHSFGLSPMVRMYTNPSTGYPSTENPWFNPDYDPNYPGYQARHPYHVGYDFNHESNATKYFIDRVTSFWLTEYKVDGFRFDLTKGLTQKSTYIGSGNYNEGNASAYDASRIKILKRMANKIWEVSPGAYVILEHFCDNSEETELAANGMMLWGNFNSSYNESTMGYFDNNKSDFSWISYKKRGWASSNVVGYMESHDEERLMFKNVTYGNSSGTYSVKNLNVALNRMKLAGAFFFTIPGPKMIWQFGELGYGYSINYPSGTSADRLTPKPIKWDYYSDPARLKLFKVWSALIGLKKNYPAFSSDDFTLSVSNAFKRMWINDSSMNVTILGNFDVNPVALIPQFQNTGTWYDYFTGEQIDVSTPINLDAGGFKIYTTVKLPTPEEGILSEVNEIADIPSQFSLEQNYPNPFNPSTKIRYTIPTSPLNPSPYQGEGHRERWVTLKVYDILGKAVTTLVNEEQSLGIYEVEFNGNNLSSGVYFYQLKADNFVITKKLILMK
jgi:1,4-alpha-glucan branching enzyme